ncbi:S8 family serine peptidase [Ornithinimicrobium faecis]|uniref:S8 family serine peptidase n=1 Tax=Ornithinimicrobium faecis TaxID=2934158 RepID=A0ABY4YXX9_9MICO|nr:S8 family serine peptidase [Ornithinimicrobium sp. HY1793]USQ81501.1 S8 family serine peptidase [Ornithinimicrobium sp. HY1793]
MHQQPARAARPRLLRTRRLAYGVLAVPLVISPLATSAQETDTADTTSPAAATDWTVLQAADAGPAPEGEDVTLITGDTVHVTATADGGHTASVTPASGTGETGFLTHEQDGDLFVVPSNLAALIPQRLDPALFNVSDLVESGFTDTKADAMPVIFTYQQDAPVPAAARAVDGDALELESVNGLGLALDKTDDTPDVAAALEQLARGANPNARSAGSGALAGLEKIWLDHPVEAMLDESVPQIGAPEAWEQGFDGTGVKVAVLDSGIDAEHADLAGQVVDAKNFSEADSTDDKAGHGTHVASTIAGTGAASDGKYVGVAPGASLLNAKVLDDFGNGSTSGVIEGMEWAAEQGADVINMSLGVTGFYSDGTDPGSMAVNTITEEHSTLFVIAAGNEGPNDGTVTSPGAADLALTVGAVDHNEDIAYFSSRGPRAGDHAVKPEITGPGVDIVAARAGGTNPLFPVNEYYAYMSGTSMATPHVAGAAALLAQARPELDAMELKSVLVGSAVPNDELRVLDQGAGRVNVPTALTGEAIAEPVAMDLGSYAYPQEPVQTEKVVTYRNLGEEPLTLDLAASAQNEDGEAAGEGVVAVSPTTLSLPAGESTTATVTVDIGVEGAGQFSGAVVATSGSGQTLSTPLSWYKEPERYNVHVEGIARDGRAAQGSFRVFDVMDGSVSAFRNWGQTDNTCTTEDWGASNCIRLAPGDYSFSGMIQTMPADLPALGYPGNTADFLNTSLVVEPEVTIDAETTLTLDARDAVEVQIETPGHETRPVNGSAVQVQLRRVAEEGAVLNHGLMVGPRTQLENTLFLQPTEPVEHGELTAYTQWTLEAPDVSFQVEGNEALELEPHYYDRYWFSDNSWQFPQLEGEHSLTVMDVGTATPEELDGVDLTGTLALVRSSDDLPVADQSNNAAAAGAAMVAVYHDKPGSDAYPGASGIRLEVPTVRLSHEEGTALLELVSPGAALAKQRPTVLATGQPASPYRYSLRLTEEGTIPADLDYVLEAEDLATVTNSFHSQLSDTVTLTESWFATAPWQNAAITFPTPTVGGPRERVDYYVPEAGLEYTQHVTTPEERYNYNWPADPQALLRLSSQRQAYEPGERLERSWMAGPLRPGLWPQESMVRIDDDSLDIRLAAFVDGSGNTAMASGSAEDGFDVKMRVIADGEEVIESNIAYGTLDIPADATDYRVEYEVDNNVPWAQLSRHAKTAWTYQSAPPAEGEARIEPLLTVDYDLDVDLQNRLPAPSERKGPLTVGFTVGHQAGAQSLPVVDASLDVSYDGGETWRAIKNLREVEGNQFVANLPSNLPKGNDGTLSLRMSATDSAGSTVEQEVLRAVGLPE